MPKRTCPRTVALENRAFLRHLAETGNAHEAARRTGHGRTRFTKRRATDPNFATEWDQALTLANATLKNRQAGHPQPARSTTLCETRHGLQLRRSSARAKLTPDHEQRFLLALSATANVRLASAAAGLSHATFYARRRRCEAFAREWRAAIEQGYARVEAALLAGGLAQEADATAWRLNDPPEMPAMTPSQALQLLHLHQKAALGFDEPPHVKRRRGESREAHGYRLAAMHEARMEREREKFRAAEAERQRRGQGAPEHARVLLPALDQVTGWSKADPAKAPHDPGRALFGGWRIDDWREREGEG